MAVANNEAPDRYRSLLVDLHIRDSMDNLYCSNRTMNSVVGLNTDHSPSKSHRLPPSLPRIAGSWYIEYPAQHRLRK